MKTILAPCLALLSLPAFAQSRHPAAAHVYSSYDVGEVDPEQLRQLGHHFDLRRDGASYQALVRADQVAELQALAPGAKLVDRDIRDAFRRLDASHPGWRAYFRDVDSVVTELKQLVADHPDMATLESIGTTDEGRPQLALRLTGKAATTTTTKPELMITSATHGDEVDTVEVLMDFIQDLVKSYGTDDRKTKILDNHVVYFVPVVCPDGYAATTRECDGVDPNRDYPYPDDASHVSITALKNEQAWFATHNIIGSIDIHSDLATVMYPWAYADKAPPAADVTRFKAIGQVMAQDTGYNFGQIAEVFGIAQGSSADYWYWKNHTLAFGFEIGDYMSEPERIHELASGNDAAFLHFLENF